MVCHEVCYQLKNTIFQDIVRFGRPKLTMFFHIFPRRSSVEVIPKSVPLNVSI